MKISIKFSSTPISLVTLTVTIFALQSFDHYNVRYWILKAARSLPLQLPEGKKYN